MSSACVAVALHGVNPATLSGALDAACARWEEKPALVHERGTMSYGEFGRSVAEMASAYGRLGIGPGDRVICQVGNQPGHLIAAGAAWRCGAIHVGVDSDLVAKELAALMRRTGAGLVVHSDDDGSSEDIRLLNQEVPGTRIVSVGEDSGKVRVSLLDATGATPIRLAGTPGATFEADGPAPDDPAVIFFTSGTTGAPKGVVRYHRRLLEGWRWVGETLDVTPDDVHLGHLPFAHGFGFGMAIMALLSGGKLVLEERFSADEALHLITQEHVSVLHGAATHFALLTDRLDPSRHDIASLRIGVASSATFSPELIQRILQRLQMDLMLSYGSSEGLGWSTRDREDIIRGSVGKPPETVARIVGPDHELVAPGEVGEIVLRRVQPVHYWGEESSAATTPSEDWYHTGDLGRIDAEGRLYVLGRVKHQVNRGGMKVDPAEVEGLLIHHPQLADAAVVGLPDPVLGQIVCACLVLAGGARPSLDELRAYLCPSLARHKLPEASCVLPAIPRNQMGKVDREALHGMVDPQPLALEVHRPR